MTDDTILHPHQFARASIICEARRDVNFFELHKQVKNTCSGAKLYTYIVDCGLCKLLVILVIEAIYQTTKDGLKVVSISIEEGIKNLQKNIIQQTMKLYWRR